MNLFRTLLTVSGFTFLSRITGLIREILIARIFGVSQFTDAYYIAFRIPNLFRRISGEGAFSQAFVPILAEFKNQKGHRATQQLVNAMTTLMTWFLVILSAVGVLGATYVVFVVASGLQREGQAFSLAISMTRFMFPYILFISLTILASGVLNTYKNFSLPAFAPVLLNIAVIVGAVLISPHLHTPIWGLACGVMLGSVLQLIVQIPALKKVDMLPRLSWNVKKAFFHPGVKRVLTKMVPATFAVSVAQISLVINTNIASYLGQGAVSWVSYADRLMEFPTALFGVAIGTILLPSLSKAHVDGDVQEYSVLLDWGLRLTFLLALPCALGLIFFAQPITATLFNYGKFNGSTVVQVSQALVTYGLGLIGIILNKILAPGFYAKQDIKTPVKIALFTLLITQLGNLIFVPFLGVSGLTLSISLAACANAGLLFYGLKRKAIYLPCQGWMRFLGQLMIAAITIALPMIYFERHFDWIALHAQPMYRIGLLFGCLSIFAAIYFVILYLMGFNFSYFKKTTR